MLVRMDNIMHITLVTLLAVAPHVKCGGLTHHGEGATSYQNLEIEHYHAVPTHPHHEGKHHLEHPVITGKTSTKLQIQHGGKHDHGHAISDIQTEYYGHDEGHHYEGQGHELGGLEHGGYVQHVESGEHLQNEGVLQKHAGLDQHLGHGGVLPQELGHEYHSGVEHEATLQQHQVLGQQLGSADHESLLQHYGGLNHGHGQEEQQQYAVQEQSGHNPYGDIPELMNYHQIAAAALEQFRHQPHGSVEDAGTEEH